MSTSSQRTATSSPLCCFRVGYMLNRPLMSRIIGNTHTHMLSDQRKHEKERESTHGDILLLISAPPLGSIRR